MEKKTVLVTIRLSQAEREAINENALALGMSVSQYIRFVAITAPKFERSKNDDR